MTMMFIAGVPPQSCSRGMPRNPEFMKMRDGMKARLSSLKSVAYRNEERVSRITMRVVAPAKSRTRDACMSLL